MRNPTIRSIKRVASIAMVLVLSAAASSADADRPLSYWVAQATATNRSESLDRVVDALAQAVRGDDASAKVMASDALAALGPDARAAVPVLLAQLDNEQPWVRAGASGALAAVGKPAVPALIELFERQAGGPSVRAAFILGAIGGEASPAIPAITTVMAGESEAMRARYAEILNQIDPARFPGNETRGIRRTDRVNLDSSDTPGVAGTSLTSDWPQFHGPRRDSNSREIGLLQRWPEGGPDLLWTLEGLGRGFSSVSIADGRIITMGDRPTDAGEEAQFVIAHELQSRNSLWATRVGAPFRTGPRCTPTIDGDRVYAIGTDGDLVCLKADTGVTLWRRNLPDDFGGKVMSGWKYSESPLIDGDRVICTPGGVEALMVALDKRTGDVVWKCASPAIGDKGSDGAGYASALVAEIHGTRQYVQMFGRGVIGVEAATGKLLWGYNRIANNIANITAPVVRGDYVFVTTAYNTGSALLEIKRDDDGFRAEEIYFLSPREFQNHHGGVVLAGDYVYGGHRPNSGFPTCIDLATGRVCWSERSPASGSASVIYADGHVIFRYDRGEVLLVEATPEAFRIKGRFTAVKRDGPAWAHPVIHRGKLYLRHDDALFCYDLRDYMRGSGSRARR